MPLNYSQVEEIGLNRASIEKVEDASDGRQDALLAIEEAAAKEDRRALGGSVKKIDWRTRRPDELTRVIHLCLFLDMVLQEN